MKKRIAALILSSALVAGAAVGFAGCGGSSGGTITLWGPSAQQDSLQEMVNLFLEKNPDYGLEIKLGVAGEGDAYSMMSNDPQSGADVFAYANDQIANLYSLGALARLGDAAVTDLKTNNTEDSVNAGKIGDGYYGYPYAADNGFFMYYDKSVVSEEQAKTLKGVMDACAAAGKYFIYQLTTGWYAGSFIYGAGGKYEVTYSGSSVSDIVCNFDEKLPGSDYTYGELGGQQLMDIKTHDAFVDGDDNVISSYLQGINGTSRFGACISGTWNAGLIESYLGENYAATVLPTWESSLNGETYAWKSFAGYKLYGVNAFSKNLSKAHQLAAFLSSKDMQEKRFDDSAIGPANKAVAAMDKVKNNVAISTITRQIAENSVIQTAMPGSYWTEMESFANAMKSWDGSGNLLERVQQLVTALKANG